MQKAVSSLSALFIVVQTFTFLVDLVGLYISKECLQSAKRPREGLFKCWRKEVSLWSWVPGIKLSRLIDRKFFLTF